MPQNSIAAGALQRRGIMWEAGIGLVCFYLGFAAHAILAAYRDHDDDYLPDSWEMCRDCVIQKTSETRQIKRSSGKLRTVNER